MKTIPFFILIVAFVGFKSCKKEIKHPPKQNTQVDIPFKKEGELQLIVNDTITKNLDIELAISATERNNGLMNRNSLGENQGMLFLFEKDNHTTFWMKDTRIALDILFFGADSVLLKANHNAQPYDTSPGKYGSPEPYRFVLEINGGLSEKWGVQEGVTKISW